MKHKSKYLLALLIIILSANNCFAAFCIKCGVKLKKDIKFCPKCGHKFGAPLYEKEEKTVKPKPVPVFENIEDANAYFDLAEKERASIGALLLPHVKRRRYEKSLNLYLKILEKWPNSDKCEASAYHIASIYGSSAFKQYDKAIRYFRMVVDINPETTMDSRLRIAKITEDKIHDFNGAIPLYEDVIANARVQDEKEKAAKELRGLRERIEKSQDKINK
ncbi:MAG: zinc-ribbon domain-containing protein [Planctomycetota bacterium]|jgi:tetratricopeptide (TPR) repeat protein